MNVFLKLVTAVFWIMCLGQYFVGDPASVLTPAAGWVVVCLLAVHLLEYTLFLRTAGKGRLSHAKDLPLTLIFGIFHLQPLVSRR